MNIKKGGESKGGSTRLRERERENMKHVKVHAHDAGIPLILAKNHFSFMHC